MGGGRWEVRGGWCIIDGMGAMGCDGYDLMNEIMNISALVVIE